MYVCTCTHTVDGRARVRTVERLTRCHPILGLQRALCHIQHVVNHLRGNTCLQHTHMSNVCRQYKCVVKHDHICANTAI